MNQGVAPLVGTPAPGGSPYGQQVSLPVGLLALGRIKMTSLSEHVPGIFFSHLCSVSFQVGVLGPPGQQAPPPYPGPHPAGPPVIQQPSTPMFVAPPPKTQRLLHSEAYLKYIEGLTAESNSISKWDQTLAGKESPSDNPCKTQNSSESYDFSGILPHRISTHFSSFSFCLGGLGPHVQHSGVYFQLCSEITPSKFEGPYGMPGSEPGLAACLNI